MTCDVLMGTLNRTHSITHYGTGCPWLLAVIWWWFRLSWNAGYHRWQSQYANWPVV